MKIPDTNTARRAIEDWYSKFIEPEDNFLVEQIESPNEGWWFTISALDSEGNVYHVDGDVHISSDGHIKGLYPNP